MRAEAKHILNVIFKPVFFFFKKNKQTKKNMHLNLTISISQGNSGFEIVGV